MESKYKYEPIRFIVVKKANEKPDLSAIKFKLAKGNGDVPFVCGNGDAGVRDTNTGA